MKINKRYLAILFFVVCAIIACITVYASSTYCDTYGHTIDTIVSHGSAGYVYPADGSYCWRQNHTGCVAKCYFCGDEFLTDHIEKEQHTFVYTYNNGYYWKCSKCGYIK